MSSERARAQPPARLWPLTPGLTAALVGACIGLGVAAGLVIHRLAEHGGPAVAASAVPVRPALDGDAVWKAGARAAPGFALHDQNGKLVSLAGQRGSVVLLAFMDSHCKLLCTLEGPTLHRVLGRLGDASSSVRLLVVSVNPWEDTAASSVNAGERWGFTGPWRWLRGTPAQLSPVWRGYGIEVKQAFGDVNHSSAIYLIDRRGWERAGFNYPFPASRVTRDLRRLAAEPAS
ncbi:MAG TPA: SCO family protein [Thermoleophilaceae bacterium]|nr:SCO family protein [Thermoleophilaceae bacterium]